MVRTSANLSVRYGLETAFGAVSPALMRWLGLDAKPKYELNGNPMDLYDIGQQEVESFGEGAIEAMCNISSTLSTPWPLSLPFADNTTVTPTTTGSGDAAVTTHTWTVKPIPQTISLDTRVNASGGAYSYTMLGTVMQSLKLSATVKEYVKCDMSFKSGKVAITPLTTYTKHAARVGEPNFPFTFKYGDVLLDSVRLGEVENFSADIQTGNDIQYELGTNEGVSAYDGQYKYSGTLKYALKDRTVFEKVKNGTSGAVLKFVCDNDIGQSSSTDKSSIELEFSNVVMAKGAFSAAGIERLFNDVSWKAGKCKVIVKNKYATRNPTT